MKHIWDGIPLLVVLALATGCGLLPFGGPQATPTLAAPATATAFAPPTLLPTSTAVPSATALPPTPTQTFTATPAAPTETPQPTETPTLTPTSTRTPAPVIVRTATRTATPLPPLKYGAPVLLEPENEKTRVLGRDALVFKWKPVGDLGAQECYYIDVRVINPVDSVFAQQTYQNNCGQSGSPANLSFILNRRPPGDDYAGLVAIATSHSPSNMLRVRWQVTVGLAAGSGYVPLSPTSQPFEFILREP